jgi:hypothetical protein
MKRERQGNVAACLSLAFQRRTGLALHWRTATAEACKIKDTNLARTARSSSEVGSVNERERIRQFSQNPLMKREADPGKPMISSPLNERERHSANSDASRPGIPI